MLLCVYRGIMPEPTASRPELPKLIEPRRASSRYQIFLRIGGRRKTGYESTLTELLLRHSVRNKSSPKNRVPPRLHLNFLP